jgi:hypothetical protein
MAARTSSQAGPWNDTATWGGSSVPVSGDTVDIRHVVTIPTGYTAVAGTAPADSTTFDIIINGAFATACLDITGTFSPRSNVKVLGDGLSTVRFIQRAGSVVEFDGVGGQAYNFKWETVGGKGIWQSIYASGAYPIFRSKSGGGKVFLTRDTGHGILDWHFIKFTDVESAANEFWASTPAQTSTVAEGCIFDACGDWFCDSGATDGTAAVSRDFDACTWKNSTGTRNIFGAFSGGATGTLRVRNCVFDKRPVFSSAQGLATCSGNTFLAKFGMTASGAAVTMSANLLRQADDADGMGVYGNMDGNYFLSDGDRNNPHYFEAATNDSNVAAMALSNNIFEYTGSAEVGDVIAVAAGLSNARNYDIENNITLPSSRDTTGAGSFGRAGVRNECGTMLSLLGNANVNIRKFRHNTVYMSHQGALTWGETYVGHTGMVDEFIDNLVWSDANAASGSDFPAKIRSLTLATQDTVAATVAHHNGGFNLIAGSKLKGYNCDMSGTPGDNDVEADPEFVDDTRNMASWDLSLGGAGTVANALAELAKRNDESGYNPDYTIADLITYVRAGFAPTNPDYDAAASDGTTIGAVAYEVAAVSGVFPRTVRAHRRRRTA